MSDETKPNRGELRSDIACLIYAAEILRRAASSGVADENMILVRHFDLQILGYIRENLIDLQLFESRRAEGGEPAFSDDAIAHAVAHVRHTLFKTGCEIREYCDIPADDWQRVLSLLAASETGAESKER